MDILRVKFSGLKDETDLSMITPAYQSETPVLPGQETTRLADLLALWGPLMTFMSVFQVTDWRWTAIKLFIISALDGTETFYAEDELDIPGTGPGPGASAFESVLLKILVAGDPRNALMFWPALLADDEVGQEWSNALSSALGGVADTWAAGIPLGLASENYTAGMWSKTKLAFFPSVGTGEAYNNIRHQVRRRIGRGA